MKNPYTQIGSEPPYYDDFNAEKNYMLIKGNVPGPKRGLVVVKTTVKKVKHVEPKVLLEGKEA